MVNWFNYLKTISDTINWLTNIGKLIGNGEPFKINFILEKIGNNANLDSQFKLSIKNSDDDEGYFGNFGSARINATERRKTSRERETRTKRKLPIFFSFFGAHAKRVQPTDQSCVKGGVGRDICSVR